MHGENRQVIIVKSNLRIGIPSRNLSGNLVSFTKVFFASLLLDRIPQPTFSDSSTICMARTSILKSIRDIEKKSEIRMLWLDSDIMIMNEPDQLAAILKDADKKDINILGLYNLTDGRTSATGSDGRTIITSDDESPLYIPAKYGGLGFYYGRTPLEYAFHEEFGAGEDYNFFVENEINVHVDTRVQLKHNKNLFI